MTTSWYILLYAEVLVSSRHSIYGSKLFALAKSTWSLTKLALAVIHRPAAAKLVGVIFTGRWEQRCYHGVLNAISPLVPATEFCGSRLRFQKFELLKKGLSFFEAKTIGVGKRNERSFLIHLG